MSTVSTYSISSNGSVAAGIESSNVINSFSNSFNIPKDKASASQASAIGGAVGTAAAISRGEGENIGFACAVITVLAIFGGKYAAMSSFQSEMIDALNGDGSNSSLQAIYDESISDALAFADLAKDDTSMVFESLGLMDFISLVLGVGTAFQLGRTCRS